MNAPDPSRPSCPLYSVLGDVAWMAVAITSSALAGDNLASYMDCKTARHS